jgi:small-conductance mechanosensitive channel
MQEIQSVLSEFLSILLQYKINIAITLLILVANSLLVKGLIPVVRRYTRNSRLKPNALEKARISIRMVTNIISIVLILFVWGFDFNGLMTMSVGLIALLGVSLFASWSILSNVTAFFLLVFHESYKRGNFIRVIAGDNYLEGYISEINLFNTKLITEDKEVIVYPNIQLMSNPALINPRTRFNVIGKISAFEAEAETEIAKRTAQL